MSEGSDCVPQRGEFSLSSLADANYSVLTRLVLLIIGGGFFLYAVDQVYVSLEANATGTSAAQGFSNLGWAMLVVFLLVPMASYLFYAAALKLARQAEWISISEDAVTLKYRGGRAQMVRWNMTGRLLRIRYTVQGTSGPPPSVMIDMFGIPKTVIPRDAFTCILGMAKSKSLTVTESVSKGTTIVDIARA